MNASRRSEAPVFVDVDTGVDDALALIYLLASADADLVGIASTGGNVAVDQVCANNFGLLELCRITDVPVSKGADEPLSGPMRPFAETYTAPGAWGMPTCRRPIVGSPATTPRRRGCVRHMLFPVS